MTSLATNAVTSARGISTAALAATITEPVINSDSINSSVATLAGRIDSENNALSPTNSRGLSMLCPANRKILTTEYRRWDLNPHPVARTGF
jgi:hypothetical protein